MNDNFIPYGKQWLDESDIEAVVEVLRSDWLTTGPVADHFSEAVLEQTEAFYSIRGIS